MPFRGRCDYNLCGHNGTTPRHVIPRERSESRNLPELQILSCGGSLSNVVDSSTPLRCGRNDKVGTFLRIRPLFPQCFTLYRIPSSGSPRRASFPQGKLLYRAFGKYHSTTQVVFGTWRAADCRPYRLVGAEFHSTAQVVFGTFPERHIGRSLRFRWWVVPFNRTGCIRNVAGGKIVAPTLRGKNPPFSLLKPGSILLFFRILGTFLSIIQRAKICTNNVPFV